MFMQSHSGLLPPGSIPEYPTLGCVCGPSTMVQSHSRLPLVHPTLVQSHSGLRLWSLHHDSIPFWVAPVVPPPWFNPTLGCPWFNPTLGCACGPSTMVQSHSGLRLWSLHHGSIPLWVAPVVPPPWFNPTLGCPWSIPPWFNPTLGCACGPSTMIQSHSGLRLWSLHHGSIPLSVAPGSIPLSVAPVVPPPWFNPTLGCACGPSTMVQSHSGLRLWSLHHGSIPLSVAPGPSHPGSIWVTPVVPPPFEHSACKIKLRSHKTIVECSDFKRGLLCLCWSNIKLHPPNLTEKHIYPHSVLCK